MKASNFLTYLNEHGKKVDLSGIEVAVMVHQPGSLGPTQAVSIKGALTGFDQGVGKILIEPEAPLTQLTAQEVQAITQSAREGQSWASRQLLEENQRLRTENDALKGTAAEAQEAGTVLHALASGSWQLTKYDPDPDMTDAYNTDNAWGVQRTKAPFADKENVRFWSGRTALDALCNASQALFSESFLRPDPHVEKIAD